MASTGRALPDPLFVPATGSAMPSTASCIVLPGAIDLGTCTTAGISVLRLAVTMQVGRHCGGPAAPNGATWVTVRGRLAGRVFAVGFGQSADSVTPTGSVTVASVTSYLLPAGSRSAIR